MMNIFESLVIQYMLKRKLILGTPRSCQQPRPQGLLGVQNGGLEKTVANSTSRFLKLANHEARCQFETIKVPNMFGDT